MSASSQHARSARPRRAVARRRLLTRRGKGTTESNFEVSGPLTETVLLGVLAMRVPGQRIHWDGPGLRVTNVPALNDHLHIDDSPGWSLG